MHQKILKIMETINEFEIEQTVNGYVLKNNNANRNDVRSGTVSVMMND